jgi:hypothetical protein
MIEPGNRLAGRYRLEEVVSQSGGSTLWKAIDEILARAVAVRTFEPDFPRVGEVVTAARAASRLTDPRLTQVFDADDSGESAYVVSEWAVGESLEEMLRKAPLEPGRAATLLHEAAEAIAAAHAAGLAHLCLCPRDLLWTTGGTVKLLGVAVDAELIDKHADDPAREDALALGRMLYAAVTARWPGVPERCRLPEAPKDDGVWRAPRLVQAGVPQGLDSIICRVLGLPGANGGQPLNSPAELARALRAVPRTPLPLFTGPALGPPPAVMPRPARPAPRPPAVPAQQVRTASHTPPPPAPSAPPTLATTAPRAARALNPPLIAVGAAAATVIAGLGMWGLLGNDGDRAGPGAATPRKTTAQQSTPSAVKLPIVDVKALDEPAPSFPGKNDPTIQETVALVHDGKSSTIWKSQSYFSPKFGNYLTGMGVLLDMGASVTVSRVTLTVPSDGAGAAVQLRIGDENSPELMTKVHKATTSPGRFDLTPATATRGRYVLVWFTKLPASPHRLQVAEAVVFGNR